MLPGSITGVKISVSLPAAEVEFLDEYAHQRDVGSRSAAVLRGIELLRQADLSDAYEEAWDEWEASGDAELWDPAAADGLPTR